jgi:hypothetical protein
VRWLSAKRDLVWFAARGELRACKVDGRRQGNLGSGWPRLYGPVGYNEIVSIVELWQHCFPTRWLSCASEAAMQIKVRQSR